MSKDITQRSAAGILSEMRGFPVPEIIADEGADAVRRFIEFFAANTCADGAQEYGVLRRQDDHYVQIESLTFSWMNEAKALEIIRRVLAGEFDEERYGLVDASRSTSWPQG